MKEKINTLSGITLIALVVTIVILIILATISVNLVLNSGLLDRTTKGADLHKQEEGKEAIVLAISVLRSDTILNNEKLTLDYIGDHIHEELKIDKEDVTKNGEPTESVDVIYKDYEYKIDEDFNITIIGSKEERVEITYRYEIKEEEKVAIIYLTATTQDENGIKRIIKPDGTVKEYSNKEKEVTIEYTVKGNGKYLFTAEGNNGKTRKRTVKVEGLDYFNVSFDSAKDFLTIEQAHDTSLGTKTTEQNEIINTVGSLVSDHNILYASKIENDNWTVIGNAKAGTLDNYYLYDKYRTSEQYYYTEGTWTSWTSCTLSLASNSYGYANYTFNSSVGTYYTGDYTSIATNWGSASSPRYFYGPVTTGRGDSGKLIGSTLTQYRIYGAGLSDKREKRTKTSVRDVNRVKGTLIGEVVEDLAKGLPTNGTKAIDGVYYWYIRKTQAKPYYLYKYIDGEIQTTYDVKTSQVNTKEIKFAEEINTVKILVDANNTNYKLSISKDNENWIQIEDKTQLNGESEIELPEAWSNMYIKIERNGSIINQIVVK